MIRYVVMNNHDLLESRHIDQIVLAALYGVCKIHNVEVTFKDLVQAYRDLPNTNVDTWMNVPLINPGERGNIIAFYNDVRRAPSPEACWGPYSRRRCAPARYPCILPGLRATL